jgi:hypothetical protein
MVSENIGHLNIRLSWKLGPWTHRIIVEMLAQHSPYAMGLEWGNVTNYSSNLKFLYCPASPPWGILVPWSSNCRIAYFPRLQLLPRCTVRSRPSSWATLSPRHPIEETWESNVAGKSLKPYETMEGSSWENPLLGNLPHQKVFHFVYCLPYRKLR